MSRHKLNVLRWHMTDWQSFPTTFTSPQDLAAAGSLTAAERYTMDDVRSVTATAFDHGIQMVFELDLPAHSLSWGMAKPELFVRCGDDTAWKKSPVNPLKEAFYDLYEDLVRELAAATVEPRDAWLHLGADEAAPECWQADPVIAKYLFQHKMTPNDLYSMFEARLVKIALKHFGHVVAWEDAINAGVTFDKKVAIIRWLDTDATLKASADAGHVMIDNAATYINKDYSPWRVWYGRNGPHPRAVGGEICLWSELIDKHNFMCRAWSKAVVIAHLFWSPLPTPTLTDDNCPENLITQNTPEGLKARADCPGLASFEARMHTQLARVSRFLKTTVPSVDTLDQVCPNLTDETGLGFPAGSSSSEPGPRFRKALKLKQLQLPNDETSLLRGLAQQVLVDGRRTEPQSE